MIKFLKHTEIDKTLWNRCIEASPAGRVYAMSWFLDAVSPGWAALVENNYQSVMPLPLKKSWAISYVRVPVYAQQLGVFNHSMAQVNAGSFIEAIPANIKYACLQLNSENFVDGFNYKSQNMKNFELPLFQNYVQIEKGYHSNTRRNLTKAIQYGLTLDTALGVTGFINFKKQVLAGRYNRQMYNTLQNLVNSSMLQNVGYLWAVRNPYGDIEAALFFIFDGRRLYYLSPTSSNSGKEKRAMFYLVDALVQKYSGNSVVLDFEGSNIESIARFFAGFGALPKNYTMLTINRLPWPLNLIKK